MNITYMEERNIEEKIIKLSPEDYEETLKLVKDSYTTNKERICEAIRDSIMNLPGIFIQLTFIIDLSDEEPLFLDDMEQIIEIALKTDNPDQLLNLLINLYFLGEYNFLKENEVQNFLETNKLDILAVFQGFSISQKYIQKTKKETEKNYDIELPHVMLSDDIKTPLVQIIKEQETKYSDTLIAFQIIKSFSFSHIDCRSYLLNYFFNNDYTCIIIAIFQNYATNANNLAFLISLFVCFCRVEAFLSTFYVLMPEILENEKSREFVNVIMQLLYEKYYYPHRETKSLYKQYAEYDPFLHEVERRMFLDCLNDEMIYRIKLTSDKDVLRTVLNDTQKHLLPYNKIIDCDVIDLYNMVRKSQYDDLDKVPKLDFFRSFLSIAQYSISHYLSYMELLKEHFKMNEQDQKLFYETLKDLYSDKEVFCQIIIKKMIKFNILHESIVN